ncbi:MAG: His/Gly/Thr/Pro-type tRNA ligase C-terminal domain-containing protein [Candidatus Doudnabacteria bacterium]|nr:His/Gly/Thr/Pro-type tRNA ligase C-terminal domain-containing protein [Candidatus Doudnabacteria bacterium]
MRQSKYFLKTSKTISAEDVSVNARLLEQGGFVQKVMAGVYDFLPLGLRVLSKIENIVREEMDKIGSEMFMPVLHPKENWEKTGRWSGLDVLFKVKSQHGYEYALGPTHEEIVTPAAQSVINSYKDLPLAVYQIQTKFRDEPRAKSGLLRGREFRMKDLYSFHATAEDLEDYYNNIAMPAYESVYNRLGLDALLTEASGGTFSKYSHEYQVEIENGEDTIYICEKCRKLAKNKEIFEEGAECTNCGKTTWRETKASEAGNIFKLQDKYSKAFNLQYTAQDGSKKPVLMGCYGIGTTRAMGIIVEKFHDDKGIIWPEAVAPFKAHLLALKGAEAAADKIYQSLLDNKVEVLYDDRDQSAGAKFADSDLFGIPYRVLVSAKTALQESVEIKKRNSAESELIKINELKKLFTI